jgi:hypothetical protein
MELIVSLLALERLAVTTTFPRSLETVARTIFNSFIWPFIISTSEMVFVAYPTAEKVNSYFWPADKLSEKFPETSVAVPSPFVALIDTPASGSFFSLTTLPESLRDCACTTEKRRKLKAVNKIRIPVNYFGKERLPILLLCYANINEP